MKGTLKGGRVEKKYTKLDFAKLIGYDWPSFEGFCRVDDAGIWLLEENAPGFQGLSDDERNLFLEHPVRDANKPVLPFPFSMDEFLKFAALPAFELRDFYTFADNTVDVEAIERLDLTHAPAAELARALLFGEHPKPAAPDGVHGETASVQPGPGVTTDTYDDVGPAKAATVAKGWMMKKAALIAKHAHQWSTIKGDFHSASENGLSKAAKAPGHGEWFEAAALDWARQRGKLKEEQQQIPASLATVWTGEKHTIEG